MLAPGPSSVSKLAEIGNSIKGAKCIKTKSNEFKTLSNYAKLGAKLGISSENLGILFEKVGILDFSDLLSL